MKFNRPSLTASGLTAFVLILTLALAGAAQHKAKPSARPRQPIADVQRDILGLSGVISRLMSARLTLVASRVARRTARHSCCRATRFA